MRTARNTVAAGIVAALAVLTPLVVHRIDAGGTESVLDRDTLVIGVKGDQPGLGLATENGFEGFDVDVATYVANKLGVKNPTFHKTDSDEREQALRDGTVDLVFATYSITPARKEEVTFGGPYYVAHQDILVHAREQSIKNVRDLSGKRLCQADGSYSWQRVTEEREVPAELVRARSYSACVTELAEGNIDAVSTDDLILAGFAAQEPDVMIVNAPFTSEKYGVGLRKGDRSGCEVVNRILTEMYQDGTAETLLMRWFRTVGLNVATTVPQFEGCA